MVKKYFLFTLLISLMTLNSTCLFAFDNKYYSVTDTGWEVKKQPNDTMSFVLKDFESDSEIEFKPTITVSTKDYDEVMIPNYDAADKRTIRKAVEKNVYDVFMEAGKKSANIRLAHLSPKEREKQIDDLFSDSKIDDCDITTFGGKKAFHVGMKIGKLTCDCYTIMAYKCECSLLVLCHESTSIESLDAYKKFKKSFKIKAADPTYTNYILRNFFKTKLFWIILVSIGGYIGKKMKAND